MKPNQEEQMRKNMKMYSRGNDNPKTPKSNQVENSDSKMKSPMFIPPSLKTYVDETWYVVDISYIELGISCKILRCQI